MMLRLCRYYRSRSWTSGAAICQLTCTVSGRLIFQVNTIRWYKWRVPHHRASIINKTKVYNYSNYRVTLLNECFKHWKTCLNAFYRAQARTDQLKTNYKLYIADKKRKQVKQQPHQYWMTCNGSDRCLAQYSKTWFHYVKHRNPNYDLIGIHLFYVEQK